MPAPTARHGAIAGILAVVLLVVGNFMTGSPPKFAASSASVMHYYSSHHKAILIGMILTGLAIVLYVWFIAQLALALRGPVGAVVALGGIGVAAAATVGDGLTAALAQAAKTGGSPDTIRIGFQVSALAYSRLLWFAIAVSVAIAMAAGAGALRTWLAPVMYAQAILMLLGGVSLKSSGFFSPTGGMALIAFLAYFVGTLAIAVAFLQSAPATAEAHAPAASPV